MKATIVRALTAAGALALGIVVGSAVQPAGAAPATASDCSVQQSPSPPDGYTPLARGHLVAV